MTTGRRILLIYGALAVFSIFPLLGTLLALAIASITGAPMSDNMPAPVSTLSSILVMMGYGGMLTVCTLPLGILLVVGFSIFLLIRRRSHRVQG